MKIFALDNNRFAIGKPGKLATFTVTKTGKTWHGVRGRRTVLDKRFTIVPGTKVPAQARELLTAAVA